MDKPYLRKKFESILNAKDVSQEERKEKIGIFFEDYVIDKIIGSLNSADNYKSIVLADRRSDRITQNNNYPFSNQYPDLVFNYVIYHNGEENIIGKFAIECKWIKKWYMIGTEAYYRIAEKKIERYKCFQNGAIKTNIGMDVQGPIRTFICLGMGYKDQEEFCPKALYMIPVEGFYGKPEQLPNEGDVLEDTRLLSQYILDRDYKINPDKIEYCPADFKRP